MEITDIKVRRFNSEGRMKAIVSVTFDDCFVIHDMKVIEGPDKIFVAMPRRPLRDGNFTDTAHPINAEMRAKLESAIFEEYEAAKARAAEEDLAAEA